MKEAVHKSDLELKIGTMYLAFTGELWGVFCEDFRKKWPRYNDTAMYRYIVWQDPYTHAWIPDNGCHMDYQREFR